MDKRRMFGALLVMVALIGVLTLRVFWIQTLASSRFSSNEVDLVKQSVLQREQRLLLDSGRGDFLDRNGRPLTGESYPALLVFPVNAEEESEREAASRLSRVLGTEPEVWYKFKQNLDTPRFWSGGAEPGLPKRLTEGMVQAIDALQLDGLAIVPYERRYIPPYPAAQLVGFIGQDPDRLKTEFAPMLEKGRLKPDSRIGAAGLEKTFEPLLSGLGGTYISLYTDSVSRPISGIGYRLHAPSNPYYPLQVVTTLDRSLQLRLEELADRAGLRDGAIVVLDAATAEVAGMVSRPAFNPDRVDPGSSGWSNRALKEAVPGSIFKTVVAAAALEYGVARPDEAFECNGAWGKYHFTCWKEEGHGTLTFRQAFAESCNIVFGRIMKRLKPEQLEDTAKRMGIGLPAGWEGELLRYPEFHQLDGEDAGRIWADGSSRKDEGANLQTSIGQRDVRMTPLQAANMVVTLLNGGEAREVRAVREVRYQTGRVLAKFPEKSLQGGGDGISKAAASILSEWMKDVVEHGTGTALQKSVWTLAGKSGTAQAPEGDKEWYNQWFIGYGPAEAPRYAVAVVSLKQSRSGPEALRLFGQVMDLLAAGEDAT
jgi:penicillin-binding protein 4B